MHRPDALLSWRLRYLLARQQEGRLARASFAGSAPTRMPSSGCQVGAPDHDLSGGVRRGPPSVTSTRIAAQERRRRTWNVTPGLADRQCLIALAASSLRQITASSTTGLPSSRAARNRRARLPSPGTLKAGCQV